MVLFNLMLPVCGPQSERKWVLRTRRQIVSVRTDGAYDSSLNSILKRNVKANALFSSEIQGTWRTITEKRSAGHIADIYTVTSPENAGWIFPSKLFLASSHICRDPEVSVIWRDKTEMWIFLALSSHFKQHYGFWQQSVWGIFQQKEKWNCLFSIHSRNLTGHYCIQTLSTWIDWYHK